VTTLGASTWPTIASGAARILLLPLGSTEQHGPHLPLDTDTRIATACASTAADRRPDTVVAPALPYGASGEHTGFAGTISMGTEALATVLVEITRSMTPPLDRLVLVNGHGGNAAAVDDAIRRCDADGRPLHAWWPRIPGGDAHAGRTETSLMLAIASELVDLDTAARGNTTPLDELAPALRRDGVAMHSPTGVLGDPTGASADEGHQLLELLVADLTGFLDALTVPD